MDRKIRVGAVSYLNTKPLIYGIEKGMMKEMVELVIDYPANIAHKLIHDEIDMGLVPVAIIPELKEYHIVSDFCIACDGAVASVCLFSDVPLNEVETILLDYQSRTSVRLLKILLKEHWNISPRLVEATEGYESNIKGTTAGLVIGDRAFLQRLRSKFVFDLGLAWKEMTGLPFVFAAWVSNKQLTPEFIVAFNNANRFGLTNIDAVVAQNPFDAYHLHQYYQDNIKFKPEFDKLEVITLFLEKLKAYR
ncbi:MAG: menaquinone biosynthesis protein [Ferruginibacter sp.]|nr:menaquinone biosynthesis protein [Ferruginibacter sp.]